MLTQIVAGRVWDFSHAVGRTGLSGEGFTQSISVAFGEGDAVYVLNRGYELIPNVPWSSAGEGSRVSKLTIGRVPGDEEFLGETGLASATPTEFGGRSYGLGEGQMIWPGGMALDSQENIYASDEWMNRISIFDKDLNFLRRWGSAGEGDGEFNGPSGIAVDPLGDLYIVDSRNHRVQKFTKDGKFLAKWGSLGSDDGEFNAPFGMTIDTQGFVYVADHKNHRVQKFTPEGEFVAKFGSHGTGRGQLNRPTDVAVDPDGDVYVCDWANNRVQTFTPDGEFLTSFIGDAQELSKWGKMTVDANIDYIRRRREVKSLEPEWRFALPMGVGFDAEKNRLVVADSQRGRLQIYDKVKSYMEPQRNL